MGHLQNLGLIATNNTTITVFMHNNMVMKKSKKLDTNVHWLRDKEVQKNFKIYWEAISRNRGDYFTNHCPTIPHRNQIERYVRNILNLLSQNITSIYKNIYNDYILIS